MAVAQPDYDSAPRGPLDAARHRAKVKDAIRENLPEIISEQAIITRKEKQVVRVPIRGVKSYHFVHGTPRGASGGFGTGEGEKGKVIGRRPKPGQGQPGKAGNEPGVDYLETEIQLEELIQMMMEDLGLPNLRQKEIREAVIPKGWRYDSIEPHGVRPRLDKLRSIKEAIKRTEVLVASLVQQTGCSVDACRVALDQALGDPARALSLLTRSDGDDTTPEAAGSATGVASTPAASPAGNAGAPTDTPPSDDSDRPRPYLASADLRFRTITEDVEHRSNAVVLAMMDVSASMGTMKKYLARSFFFWALSFLKTAYREVEIRFIAHTTEAKLVDEHDFFHKGESGGTSCHAAYDLAAELIDTEYPPSRWNVYPFHFSDGEDWDPDKTARSARAVLDRGVSAFGYAEIQGEYTTSVLMEALRKAFAMRKVQRDGLTYFEGRHGESPLTGVVIRGKDDLYPALRVFLRTDREAAQPAAAGA